MGTRSDILIQFIAVFAAVGAASWLGPQAFADEIPLNVNWRFHLGAASGAHYEEFVDDSWSLVDLPHTAQQEALVTGGPTDDHRQWQGICWYRNEFSIEQDLSQKVVELCLDGAMGTADVWLNEHLVAHHLGGFLPVVVDLTPHLKPGKKNVLAVRLDNHDNFLTGPKPLGQLDFNFYGGLYRGAKLVVKDRLHITHPLLANRRASGGVFTTFENVTEEKATVVVRTHFRNDHLTPRHVRVRSALRDADGNEVATRTTAAITVAPGNDHESTQQLEVLKPRLWAPDSPSRYTLKSELIVQDTACDEFELQVGIRHVRVDQTGLFLNGKQAFLRGTNRHQEYPWIGYALSDNAQYRDAKKIKDAGFDYVRLSHYPHSPAFLDACDELGIVVMNCILGWQYYQDHPAFNEYQFLQIRELVRRDRNHPCVFFWEVSLNESPMTEDFARQANQFAHEEYPGDQFLTCGWQKQFDVYIEARQHGGCEEIHDRPCIISEYGDWEYYAQNAGLKQNLWKNIEPSHRTSRQGRGAGEARLLQQATNFQEAHNDNRKTTALADGLWVMFDYNRGYSDDHEKSGCMDIFRVAKPSYYFFRSQRSPKSSGAMVHIANRWTEKSPLKIRIFSNCDEVELQLNGKSLGRQKPDADRLSTHLAFPPFTFDVSAFEPGTLRAVGFLQNEPAAEQHVTTPGPAQRLEIHTDLAGTPLQAGQKDAIFIHAKIVDSDGNPVAPEAPVSVSFELVGDGELIGKSPALVVDGIASALFRAGRNPGTVTLKATAAGLATAEAQIEVLPPEMRDGKSQGEIAQDQNEPLHTQSGKQDGHGS